MAHVGWYCNHEDEPPSERTHVEKTLVRGKWVIKKNPTVVSSITARSRWRNEPPVCPKTVRVFTGPRRKKAS